MERYARESRDPYRKLLTTPYQLVAVMALIVTLVISLSVISLYHVGLQQQQKRLVEIVKSRAGMIRVIAEQELASHGAESATAAAERVLSKVSQAHDSFEGFGESGEFTLARLDGTDIRFLLRHRHETMGPTKTVAMASSLAEPMRRALRGASGTLVGLDYRGAEVLAAHEPIPSLQWGIVAKIDLEEIRRPYLEAGFYGIAAGLLLIAVGGFAFVRIVHPLIETLEKGRLYNRMLFSESPIGLALCDFDGTFIDINPAYAAIIGRQIDETLTLSYWEVTPEEYADREREQLKLLLQNGSYGPYEKEYLHKEGHRVPVRLSGRLLEREGKRYIWSSVEDISELKRNEEILREAALVFENTHEGIMITDPRIRIVRVNSRFSEITGYSFDEVRGKNPRFLQSGRHDAAFFKTLWRTISTEGIWYGEIWNRRKNGTVFPSLQSISVIRDEKGTITGYVSVFSDISDQKANEAKLAHMATHDPLTSLPNRVHFSSNLEQAIHHARRNGSKVALFFLDLNRFKAVNDTLGHGVGDRLLKVVAQRLQSAVREEDTVARFGGDEFAVVLPDIRHLDDAVTIARKVIEAIELPLELDATTLEPSTSIGISLYPDHAADAPSLVKAADQAMYAAKEAAGTHYRVYDPS